MRLRTFCAVLALALAGAFAFNHPVHAAWSAFSDVWIESDTASYGGVGYPTRSNMFDPPTGGNSVHISAVSSTAYDAFEMQYYFSSEIIEYCSSTYAGSVPKIISGFLNENSLQAYQNNGVGIAYWDAWKNPEDFGTWTANFLIDGAPTSTPSRLALRVVCATQSGVLTSNQATPPGSTAYTSYDIINVAGTGNTPDWTLELLSNLPETMIIPTSTSETWCNSTSTGGWTGDIYAGIRNGICAAGMTLFVPSSDATNYVMSQRDSLAYRFPFSVATQIQGSMRAATSTATSSTMDLSFAFGSSTTAGSSPTVYPQRVNFFGQATYEQYVPSWLRSLIYQLFRLGIWYGFGMATYLLAKKLLRKKEE